MSLERIEMVIEGTPVAKGRARAARTPAGVQLHTPELTRRYQDLIRMIARQQLVGHPGVVPWADPVRLTLDFYLPRPRRLIWKRREMPWAWAPVKPDSSNLLKSVEDALNGILYVDDAQIVDLRVRKRFHAGPGYGDPYPRVELVAELL